MPKVLTVLQARLGSTRLPGKILLPLGAGTVLSVMVERVRRARHVGTVLVATTTDAADDAVAAAAAALDVAVFRGHPTDLLDRHYRAGIAFGADAVVKIPSDCPIIDPEAIDEVLRAFLGQPGRYDYVSNLHPPTHPDGNDVEVMTMAALEQAWREARAPEEREHTTPYIWRHPERFRLGNVTWGTGLDFSASHRLVVDYPEDYEAVRRVHEALSPEHPQYGLEEIVDFLDEHPAVAAINARHRGVHWYTRPQPATTQEGIA